MRLEERRPGQTPTAGRRRLDQVILENSLDRASTHVDIEVNQRALYTRHARLSASRWFQQALLQRAKLYPS
jgi:hypothetical protein